MTPVRETAEIWFSKTGLLVIGAVALVLGALLFPALNGQTERGPRPFEKNDMLNLRAALKAFRLEYGRYPFAEGENAFTNEVEQGKLMRVLTGDDDGENPRRIAFFEGPTATKRQIDGKMRYARGFSPETGALLDPWGSFYRIIMDANGDGRVIGPYSDDDEIRTGPILWSLGKDRVQGSSSDRSLRRGSDDVISWQ